MANARSSDVAILWLRPRPATRTGCDYRNDLAVMGGVFGTAASLNRVAARVKAHSQNPGGNRKNAINHGTFNQRLERCSQDLEKIMKDHAGDVVGGDEQDPAEHRGSEHLQRSR